MPTTRPLFPWGMRKEVSLTSLAFSPKIALNNLSSAVKSASPFGEIFPTKISPGPTSAPTRTIPSSSKSFNFSSPTFGMSGVVISGPNFVSRTSQEKSSIWIEVSRSSRTTFSDKIIASSKFAPRHGINAHNKFCPKAKYPPSVDAPSAKTSPFLTFCPFLTNGFWVTPVNWFVRTKECSG